MSKHIYTHTGPLWRVTYFKYLASTRREVHLHSTMEDALEDADFIMADEPEARSIRIERRLTSSHGWTTFTYDPVNEAL